MSDTAAQHLWQAFQNNQATTPVRELLPENDIEAAYATQRAFNQLRLDDGQRLVGRKSGATNPTAMAAMELNGPVSGLLFDVMDVPNRGEIPANRVIHPRIEGEIAFVMGQTLDFEAIGMADVMRAVDFVMPAIEIVDARTENWGAKGIDLVADNVSASHFTLGHKVQLLDQFDVSTAKADIRVNGESVAQGNGANVLGSPLNSLCWLANQMVAHGTPISEGDVILSGSLGPMVPVNKGDLVEVEIEGAGMVSVAFAAE